MSSGNVSSSSLWADVMVSLCCVETVVMACWVFCLSPHSLTTPPPPPPLRKPSVWLWYAVQPQPPCLHPDTHRQYSKVFCAASLVKELLASYSQPLAEASFIKGRKIYKGWFISLWPEVERDQLHSSILWVNNFGGIFVSSNWKKKSNQHCLRKSTTLAFMQSSFTSASRAYYTRRSMRIRWQDLERVSLLTAWWRNGLLNSNDYRKPGRPDTINHRRQSIPGMILTDRQITQQYFATELGISQERVHYKLQHDCWSVSSLWSETTWSTSLNHQWKDNWNSGKT